MSTVSLTLDEIFDLAKNTLLSNGCDDETSTILSDLIRNAERDGSVSHGLFRLPAYVAGLKSGKINGKGKPEVKKISPSVIKVQGNNSLAPVVLSKSLPELSKAAKENGVAVLAINNSHHMAAMWPETEKLAEDGLVAFACTTYKPAVAPAGAIKPLFGTNPISFAWPRPGKTPVVYDMATASMAMGEVQVAKREGHKVPLGTGLTKDGKETIERLLWESRENANERTLKSLTEHGQEKIAVISKDGVVIDGVYGQLDADGNVEYLDANGNASIVPGDIDNGSTANCGIQSKTISKSTFNCTDAHFIYACATIQFGK